MNVLSLHVFVSNNGDIFLIFFSTIRMEFVSILDLGLGMYIYQMVLGSFVTESFCFDSLQLTDISQCDMFL